MTIPMLALTLSLLRAVAHPIEHASWYGYEHRGKLMANGQPFHPLRMTCATWAYPLGTTLRFTAPSGRSVTVEVTDRGPAKRVLRSRQYDLSLGAFRRLERPGRGLVKVKRGGSEVSNQFRVRGDFRKGHITSTPAVSEAAQRRRRTRLPAEDRVERGNHPVLGTGDAGLPTQETPGGQHRSQGLDAGSSAHATKV